MRKLGDTITIDFCTVDATTGAVSDADSLPTCELFADDTDTALISPTVAKRTGKTGNYRISIPATVGNGFAIGHSYNVVVTATVSGVTAKASVYSFTLDSKRNADLQDPSVSQISDGVWDETRAGHTNPGTFGFFLDHQISDISATGGSGLTASQVANAVQDALISDHTTANTFGAKNQKGVPSENLQDYTTNVSQLALESTLTAIKGAGQTNQTLVAITNFLTTMSGKIDVTLSTRSSQTSVNSIPTNPLLTTDARLNALDTSISSRASGASVAAIPTNPLLTIDARLNSLDTSISSRASQASVSAIPINPLRTDDTRLNRLDVTVSTRLASTDARLNALDTSISSRLASADARLNALDTSVSSRASQTSVNNIPTNPLRTDDTRIPIAGKHIATEENVDTIPINPLLTNDARLNALDTSVSSRASQVSVDEIPINPLLVDDTRLPVAGKHVATEENVDTIPTNPLLMNDVRLNSLDTSISSRVATADPRLNSLDTSISSRLASSDPRLDSLDTSISSRLAADDYKHDTTRKDADTRVLDYLDAHILSRVPADDPRLSMIGPSPVNKGRGLRITAQVKDSTETIDNVRVHVYCGNTWTELGITKANGTFSTLIYADNTADGTAPVDMTYELVCNKVGYNFSNPTELVVPPTLTMDDVTTMIDVTVIATKLTIPVPTPAETCNVFEFCLDEEGRPLPAVTAKARIMSLPYDYNGALHTGNTIDGIYDPSTGQVYWNFVWGCKVQFEIHEIFLSRNVKIPEQDVARLSELT